MGHDCRTRGFCRQQGQDLVVTRSLPFHQGKDYHAKDVHKQVPRIREPSSCLMPRSHITDAKSLPNQIVKACTSSRRPCNSIVTQNDHDDQHRYCQTHPSIRVSLSITVRRIQCINIHAYQSLPSCLPQQVVIFTWDFRAIQAEHHLVTIFQH